MAVAESANGHHTACILIAGKGQQLRQVLQTLLQFATVHLRLFSGRWRRVVSCMPGLVASRRPKDLQLL